MCAEIAIPAQRQLNARRDGSMRAEVAISVQG